jgi:hypothetical protein
MPALAFSFASCPSAGPAAGVFVFLIPTLADDQRAPNASAPPELAAAGLVDEVDIVEVDIVVFGACTFGTGTDVK